MRLPPKLPGFFNAAMIPRSVTIPTLLAASVAVPYVATNAPQWRQEWNAPPAQAATAPASTAPSAFGVKSPQRPAALAAPVGPGSTLYPLRTPIEGTPSYSLADVLRMDVTKEWVYQRWPRKSTALAELDLYGVRVPLVTGTKLDDLAGSLTYFFGPDGRLRVITFRGTTGDTTQLVNLVTQRYGLQPQPVIAAGEQLFQVRRGDDVLSSLRTRPSPVLWASSPHDSFRVELELQDPANARPLAQQKAPLPTTPQPAQATPTSPAAPEAKPTEEAAAKKPAESPWQKFFPRRHVPSTQLPNLDHGNLYQ